MKWHHQVKVLMNGRNSYPERFGAIFILVILTFAIPLLQWLAGELIKPATYSTLLGNFLPIIVLGYWSVRKNLFDYHPSSLAGRVILFLLGISVLVLLILNVQYRPVSGITGRVKSPYEVVDVIVLGSIAEELIFRGAIWSVFQWLSQGDGKNITVLVGTSILFGIEHLGYWANSSWPLSSNAYLHSLSMILAGVFFGYIRLKTRSLTMPISIHMLANGIILWSQQKI
jgi:membrane protease YdiL (CAAX protease family)